MSEVHRLKNAQATWAAGAHINVDAAGYCVSPEANLPWLSARTRADFAKADGHEFGGDGARAKIAALHSSSALAVNVFDYWTSVDASPVARALGLREGIEEIRFERKFATGIGSRSPNIDIVIYGRAGTLLAIESKFLEPYGSASKVGIQDKYCPDGEGVWQAQGLNGAQAAVSAIRGGREFHLLDVAQLLKHMLGLARSGRAWHSSMVCFVPDRQCLNGRRDSNIPVSARHGCRTVFSEHVPVVLGRAHAAHFD